MAEQSPSLLTFYKNWEFYNRGLIEIIAPLSSEQLTLPAGAHQWTIGMLVQHIIANRVWWFQTWMGEGDADLAPIAHWDPAAPEGPYTIDAAGLVAGLESTWRMVADSLASWTAADLGQVFSPPAAMKEEERVNSPSFTRQWIIWHVLEHEIHHGGELSLVLGGYGLPGIYAGI